MGNMVHVILIFAQILMVQPDDQDFDVNLVARDPDTLIDMEMVKVKPRLNDKFKSLQSKYRARARNSDNVVEVVTFKTLQDWDSALSYFIYWVTIPLVQNLPLTSKVKFRFGLAWPGPSGPFVL